MYRYFDVNIDKVNLTKVYRIFGGFNYIMFDVNVNINADN
jgi:hypothetical protein